MIRSGLKSIVAGRGINYEGDTERSNDPSHVDGYRVRCPVGVA